MNRLTIKTATGYDWSDFAREIAANDPDIVGRKVREYVGVCEDAGVTPVEIAALKAESEKLFDLLNRFYQAASKIDLAYCMLADGDHSSLSGEEYERLMDVFVEVEEVI